MKSNSLDTKDILTLAGKKYHYFNLKKAANKLGFDLNKLPNSLKVLLENLLRHEDGDTVKLADLEAIKSWLIKKKSDHEIAYRPARVLMQDFTGVPAVVDLAAMRDAVTKLGLSPNKINPLVPVDLVIDHSVQVDVYGDNSAYKKNVVLEMERNKERYEFLKWGQESFNNFKVVPLGTGICHQVNLEYLAKVVWTNEINGELVAYPDTLVGTDSHTTMVNGLSVLGWGVGGIEAEAAMLGQPISMIIPEVIGFKLTGHLPEGTTATDLVLTVTQILRKKGVVDKFVEFFGDGIKHLTLSDRATIANMAPEYGATCGFFPIDEETISYLELTARDKETIALVEAYAKQQSLWYDENYNAEFTDILELDLSTVEPSLAGPKRPQDRLSLSDVEENFKATFMNGSNISIERNAAVNGADYKLSHGDIVIAAITSCTNTSNPNVMIAAGLVAKKAVEKGIKPKAWVKTSLAPGSQVVTEYLKHSGLLPYLEQIGFNIVGYGCTTCIGNSGPLKPEIEKSIMDNDLIAVAVLSGNRNFEGRIHPLVKANYLASPPLVVIYSLCGNIEIDITDEPIAIDDDGNEVFLAELWPTNHEIQEYLNKSLNSSMFKEKYADVFKGDEAWQQIKTRKGDTYSWTDSTYISNPPYFQKMSMKLPEVMDIKQARILALFGDSITTDHISPAGSISKNSPAAKYLVSKEIEPKDFNSYGSRRGNHDVMMRGTFANTRIKNKMLNDVEGGYTKYIPTNEQLSIYDAAMRYQQDNTSLVVFAGKEYGTGSSRDWAAKGTNLLGIKAVIAESFERIHRSNLIGMGVLPLVFKDGINIEKLKLDGTELIDILDFNSNLKPGGELRCRITRNNGNIEEIKLIIKINTDNELNYYLSGGILHYVLRNMAS